jgi:hypothetical protein
LEYQDGLSFPSTLVYRVRQLFFRDVRRR